MTFEALAALALFAFVSSITPGPNNLMLMASGASFGVRRTLPHMVGVGFGFVVLLFAVGVGLGQLLERWPLLEFLLRWLCLAFLLQLTWRIATAPPQVGADPEAGNRARPMTFLEAAAFQWVNPKGWAMALTTLSAYVPADGLAGLLLACGVFGLINISSVSTWTLAGQQLRRWLTSPERARAFNMAMAGLLAVSVLPMLLA